ncbi:MAG: hypothetical protein ACKOW9_03185 [Candidatus Paceibacterota bacterium]
MLLDVQFLSVETLKQNTDIEANVDDKVLNTNIMLAQQIEVQQLLGQTLYTEIQQAVSGATLTTVQRTLLDGYILPYLQQMTIYYAMPSIWGKMRNSSVVTQQGENSQAVGLDELKYRRDIVKNNAEFLGQRLVNFIKLHLSDYPNYYTATSTTDLHGRNNSYSGGLYLPDSPYYYNNNHCCK